MDESPRPGSPPVRRRPWEESRPAHRPSDSFSDASNARQADGSRALVARGSSLPPNRSNQLRLLLSAASAKYGTSFSYGSRSLRSRFADHIIRQVEAGAVSRLSRSCYCWRCCEVCRGREVARPTPLWKRGRERITRHSEEAFGSCRSRTFVRNADDTLRIAIRALPRLGRHPAK